MQQMNIFDVLYEKYKITKPIRLIELFAGYGSQALALKYLGVEFTHWHICEWATKSIQAYNDLHIRDYTDYSKDLTQNKVIDKLAAYGVSMNYNNPMTYDQIKRKGEKWQRQTYNNIIATHNLVNIATAKAKDLNITDTDKYEYILTYSFPCQDLSIAGRKQGMAKGGSTRSGMLWQVERLLDETEEKPQILIMENVPDIIGTNNIEHYIEWQRKLEYLGYENYTEVLEATQYNIPQARKRCFMVSVLNKGGYKHPRPIKPTITQFDLYNNNVDSTYLLSNNIVICFSGVNEKGNFGRGQRFISNLARENINVAMSVTTAAGQRVSDNFIITNPVYKKYTPSELRAYLEVDDKELFVKRLISLELRKLTPIEVFKLMGVKPSDTMKIAENQSQSSLYHLAGDSIVTTPLMAMFGELLGLDYETKINELVEDLKICA